MAHDFPQSKTKSEQQSKSLFMTLNLYTHFLILFPLLTLSSMALFNHMRNALTWGPLHWLPPVPDLFYSRYLHCFLATFRISPCLPVDHSFLRTLSLSTCLRVPNALHSESLVYLPASSFTLQNLYPTPLCTSTQAWLAPMCIQLTFVKAKFLRRNFYSFRNSTGM